MPVIQEGDLQMFARVPRELLDEIDKWAERHWRSARGEICAAMEAFIHTPFSEFADRKWKYERTPDSIPISNGVPAWLFTEFEISATRCRSKNEAILRALELWCVRHEHAESPVAV